MVIQRIDRNLVTELYQCTEVFEMKKLELFLSKFTDGTFTSKNRLESIYSNVDGEITITFDNTDTEISDQDLMSFVLGMRASIKKNESC